MATIYRSMRDDGDGMPSCGGTAIELGVRPGIDIPVGAAGTVMPGTGGMSVGLGGPERLPRHRRPPEHGGTGDCPVRQMESDDLPGELSFRIDPKRADAHAFVEPRIPMALAEFQAALAQSRSFRELGESMEER